MAAIALGRDAGVGDRTHFIAIWPVEGTFTFGALLWIDDKCVPLHRNRGIGTFEFANAAARAL